MFIFIVSLAATFIAGCAAFFSIKGLMVLFAGSAVAVAVMASALEVGKLVAASFLHKTWKTSSFFLKTYLTVAVGVLMLITSLGIFGFLTNAYQLHKGTVDSFQLELDGLTKQQGVLTAEIEANTGRIDSLVTIRKEQEVRVTAAGNYKLPREQAYQAIAAANEELKGKEARQIELRNKIAEIESRKVEIGRDLSAKTDVGSFKFIADSLGVDIDTAVKYFILSLVFVFDPLAISLVLALNQLIETRELKKRKKGETKEEINEIPAKEVIESAPEKVIESAPEKVIESAPEKVIESAPEEAVKLAAKSQRKLIPENDSVVRKG
jgi:hypothetical protein